MKYLVSGAVVVLAVAAVAIVAGCGGGSNDVVYGKAVPDDVRTVTIAQVLADPAEFNGKLVAIEGKVAVECPSGCWFWLRGEGGEFYITTDQSNFAIPQLVGKKLRVYGTIITQDNAPQMVALGAVSAK